MKGVFFAIFFLSFSFSAAIFEEKLTFTPLSDGKLVSYFNFINSIDAEGESYDVFPKGIGQIMKKFLVESFQLTFTQGRWDGKWGDGDGIAPAGVELIASFYTHSALDQRWKGFTHSMSGLFCSSLNYLDSSSSVTPHLLFRSSANTSTVYGILPRETVCGENFTPWFRLLPCKLHEGIASLLTSTKLYDVLYHSMSTKTTFRDGRIELNQTLTLIVDTRTKSGSKDLGMMISSGGHRQTYYFSFASLFSKSRISSCPLSSSSLIEVNTNKLPNARITFGVNETSTEESKYIFDLKKLISIAFKMTYSPERVIYDQMSIEVEKHVIGVGDEHGEMVFEIKSNLDTNASISFFTTFPSFILPFFHTLQIHINQTKYLNHQVMTEKNMEPRRQSKDASWIEFSMILPARSHVVMNIQYAKRFLHWLWYPSDPRRGFDVGPAIVSLFRNKEVDVFYSQSPVISLPTPDFSMPYNVITITCTVFAFFFGSIINQLLRHLKPIRSHKPLESERPIVKIYKFFASLWAKGKDE